ncbi:hypothetical protein BGX38DRAFT_1197255 [Terfezia claveryi]|nr:hypothetical protein BGX38DRAFT_1197255 [Terfezia claveryi]
MEKVFIWCANKGFAPELLGFERLDGGWFMVVMDFLGESWRVLNEAGVKTESISKLGRKICSVITKLHESGMVHGDIREMNILEMIKMSSC